MRSMKGLRVVVVTDSDHGHALAARLRRMEVAQVTAVDLASNKVSVIDGRGGPIHTYAATSIAQQDMLKKIKVGDVVIGLTTPLLVTAIAPVK